MNLAAELPISVITVRLIAALTFAVSELSRFFILSFRLLPSSELTINSLFKKWSLELESLEVILLLPD